MADIIIIDSDSDTDAPPQKKFRANPPNSLTPKTKPFEGVSSSSSSSSSANVSPSPSIVRSNISETGSNENKVIAEPQRVWYHRNGDANDNGATKDYIDQSFCNDTSESDNETVESGVDEVDTHVSHGAEFFYRSIPPKEIEETRRYLKDKGRLQFLQRYLPTSASGQDIIKIVLKLGFIPKRVNFDNIDLLECVQILNRAMEKVRSKRDRLDDVSTYHDAIDLIRESKRIIVITGAGISTSLGIPDFRSSKGFYSMVKHLGLSDPQEVFDLEIFHTDPTLFYSIAHMILPPEHTFSPLHSFIQLLQSKNKLLRNYTQNIDNIESYAGVRPENLIQCHGSFAGATCTSCGHNVPGESIFPDIRKQELPRCKKCEPKRKRLLRDENKYVAESFGVFKPDITFFGEALPRRFHDHIREDIVNCDLLISIGTSLKVAPVADIVDKIPHYVPQILINKDPIDHCNFDVSLLGYCDEVISFIADKLGDDWKLPHKDYDDIRGRNGENLEIELVDTGLREYKVSSRTHKTENTPDPLEKVNTDGATAFDLQSDELNGKERQSFNSALNKQRDIENIVEEGMKVGAVHWKDSMLYVGSSIKGSSQGSQGGSIEPQTGSRSSFSQYEIEENIAHGGSTAYTEISLSDDGDGDN